MPFHTLAMKSHIIADGESKLKRAPEFQAKLRALQESIHARYAAELSSARFFRRCILRWRIAMEYRRERRQIVPSSQSLYIQALSQGTHMSITPIGLAMHRNKPQPLRRRCNRGPSWAKSLNLDRWRLNAASVNNPSK